MIISSSIEKFGHSVSDTSVPQFRQTGFYRNWGTEVSDTVLPNQNVSRNATWARLAFVPSGKPCEAVPIPRLGFGVNTPAAAVKAWVLTEVLYLMLNTLKASKISLPTTRSLNGSCRSRRASTRWI